MRRALLKLNVITDSVVLTAVACGSQKPGAATPTGDTGSNVVGISGTGGATSVPEELAREYSQSQSETTCRFLEGSGSSVGIKGVNARPSDLGAMSRAPKESEVQTGIQTAADAVGYLAYGGIVEDDLSVHPIALDGFQPADEDGAYPLSSRKLGVAVLPGERGNVQGFIDYITDSGAGDMLKTSGLLAVK